MQGELSNTFTIDKTMIADLSPKLNSTSELKEVFGKLMSEFDSFALDMKQAISEAQKDDDEFNAHFRGIIDAFATDCPSIDPALFKDIHIDFEHTMENICPDTKIHIDDFVKFVAGMVIQTNNLYTTIKMSPEFTKRYLQSVFEMIAQLSAQTEPQK